MILKHTTIVTVALLVSIAIPTTIVADDQPAAPAATGGVKRALLICGLSGDAERRKAFAETMTKLHSVLTNKLGFAASDVEVLFGDESKEGTTELIQSAGPATREELEKRAQQLREKLRPEDSLWVMVFGHAHYDGQNSFLNLPGPDLHQLDFAKLFSKIPASQQIFILTTPASGFFIKPLSAKNRIVITATEADWETNETEFPAEFARILSTPPSMKELDVDEDGQISLFDLYITVARGLAQSYRDRELLATEHSLLDDNGDGRGMELQIDYLSTELGGRAKTVRPTLPTLPPKSDGHLAKTILLPIQ
jgi:hypothetical protein